MRIKPYKSFTACVEQTARLLRKEIAGKLSSRNAGTPPDLSLANKITQVAQLLRQKK